MRRKGASYLTILKHVKVSKSSLSLWLRGVYLSEKQKARLLQGREISRDAASKAKHQHRIEQTAEIVQKSKQDVKSLMHNPLFPVGLALYWAEGTKNQSEKVQFTNSDEQMVALMMRWFREICLVPESKFRVHMHIHNLHVRTHIENFWSRITGIPRTQFYKTYIKQSSLGFRRNVLYNGTCAIVISNKELLRRIVGWKLGLSEVFNISPRSSMDRTPDF